jgi:hypothetical protein
VNTRLLISFLLAIRQVEKAQGQFRPHIFPGMSASNMCEAGGREIR